MNMASLVEIKQNPKIPALAPGDTVKVSVKIVEGGKERIQVFQGVVIKVRRGGAGASFTVRHVAYGIGVERTFPVYSPLVEKVEVVRHGKVRRAKLYYLRGLSGKEARRKIKRVEKKAEKIGEEVLAPQPEEAVEPVMAPEQVQAEAEAKEPVQEAPTAEVKAEAVVEPKPAQPVQEQLSRQSRSQPKTKRTQSPNQSQPKNLSGAGQDCRHPLESGMIYAEVSVNSPVAQRRTFSYAIPARLTVSVGQAVWVPFGDKILQGIVFELSPIPAVAETREIIDVIEPEPVLSAPRISLARWISEHYLSPLFDAAALMLPPGFERKALTSVSRRS